MLPNTGQVTQILFLFTFVYPLVMAYVWMTGGLYYWLHYERRHSNPKYPPELESYPKVSFVVPCHNESESVSETLENLLQHNYPNFEVIAINDGSIDDTGALLDEMMAQHRKLRVVHLATNQGKAVGLRMAAMLADSEYLICIDGDALLDKDAARWMVRHFQSSSRVGAVTGNPRIRTRSTLLGRIQVGEFSSIIGLIKRAQRTYGRLFTVSGVVAAFSKTALSDVGFWSTDMLTEDIDVSWKLQLAHWDVRFEPAAVCWILMPETFKGLWRQRLRWAMGGVQALIKYSRMWRTWRERRMWPVYLEYVISVTWAYAMLLTFILYFLGFFVHLPPKLQVHSLIPRATGVVIGTTCILQSLVALVLDQRYDRKLMKHLFWTIWYPVAYWLLTMFTSVWALPKTILRKQGKRAVWISPDRGVR